MLKCFVDGSILAGRSMHVLAFLAAPSD
jgi:hypothetical protein